MNKLQSQILQIEEMKLKLYHRNGKDNTHYKFQKWFLDKAQVFNRVDKQQSEFLSKKIQAEIKNCYYNSWRVANTDFSLNYYEGFVIDEELPIPIEHSWLVDSRGFVIDPTLIISGDRFKKQMKKYGGGEKDGSNRLGSEYFGVKFTNEQVNKFAIETKKTGSYLYLLFKEESK